MPIQAKFSAPGVGSAPPRLTHGLDNSVDGGRRSGVVSKRADQSLESVKLDTWSLKIGVGI
jgi:hypothetical protein